MITHGRAGRQGSQTQSLVLASLGQGGDLAARTKACLPGQEDASRRLAGPCGIHPRNHNGQLVPRLSSWGHPRPSAVDKASRGWGNRQGNLCPWQGQTLAHACGSAEAAGAEWWPQGCPQPHSGNGECVTFHGKGDFKSPFLAPKEGRRSDPQGGPQTPGPLTARGRKEHQSQRDAGCGRGRATSRGV